MHFDCNLIDRILSRDIFETKENYFDTLNLFSTVFRHTYVTERSLSLCCTMPQKTADDRKGTLNS